MELKYTQKNISVVKEKNELTDTFNFRKQEKLQEIGQSKILDVDVKININNTIIENGRVTYNGEINLKVIYLEAGTGRL